MENILPLKFALFTACVVIVALTCYLFYVKRDLRNLQSRRVQDFKHFRQLVGCTRLWPGSNGEIINYNLRSFDDGETWVAIEYGVDGRVKIKGDAEQLYPGLVKSVQALDSLTIRISNSSPIDLGSSKDRNLLTQAGFHIE